MGLGSLINAGLHYVPGYESGKKAIAGDYKGAVKSLAFGPLGEDAYNLVTKGPGGAAAASGVTGAAPGLAGPLDAIKDFATPARADLSGVNQAQANAFADRDAYAAERAGLRGAYSPNMTGLLNTEAQRSIQGLQDAAAGKVPSAAELQLKNQASTNAARGFGISAALQGRSPGMALRQAQLGQAQIQGQTNADAAALRANEQANARGQLVGAIQGQQGEQRGLRAGDIDEKGQLIQAQTGALGAGVNAAGEAAKASAMDAAGQNAFKGAVIGGVTNAATNLIPKLSDEHEKTNIHHADMDALAKALEPFTFAYKNPGAPGASAGPQVGPMVQDVEKGGPAGRAMVRTLPGGKKGLDMGNMLGAALSMSAEALKRTRRAA